MAEEEPKPENEEEPSIEEILASIRQIISDDDEEGGEESGEAAPAEAPAELDEPAEAPESEVEPEPEPDDVVELTEEIDAPEQAIEEPEPEPEVVMEDNIEDDMGIEMQDIEPEPEATPEPESTEEPEEPAPIAEEPEESLAPISIPDEDALLTDRAEDAAVAGFGELVRKTKIEHSGITLEEIVRTELRPMLKDWLDDNLPAIIERLVQEELERVAKRALEEL